MADVAKYAPINGGTLISDFKSHFSLFRTKKTLSVAYGFVLVFVVFTVFLSFSPSPNSSSPWFTNVFSISTTSNGTSSSLSSSSVFSDESYRSHFSSIFSYFFPNSSQNAVSTDNDKSHHSTDFAPTQLEKDPEIVKNHTGKEEKVDKVISPNNGKVLSANETVDDAKKPPNSSSSKMNKESPVFKNQTLNSELPDKDEVLTQNQTQAKGLHGKVEVSKSKESEKSPAPANQTANSSPNPASEAKSVSGNGEKGVAEKGVIKNLTSSLMKNKDNGTNLSAPRNQESDDLIKSLMNCDLFDGNWVGDESYPLYKPGSCSLIDEQFNCFLNGRPDNGYHKMKWKPKGCTLPRLNGGRMLEMLTGKRLVFVGDSLNRNMWESLICILKNSVKDQSKVYEEQGRHHFRGEALYSFIFEEYKCRVEFFVSPFLVQEWEVTQKDGKKKETLRLDLIGMSADKYKNAEIIVFNTGHWWTHEKTSKGEDYYQEGSHVYKELNVLEAFRKAITTWGRWIDANVNPKKSLVFFRGYSASHFSGGQWNSGGACDNEIEPIKNDTYLTEYPSKMAVLEKVLKGMKTPVTYLNITRMTDYRKDGHPSIYRKQHLSDVERRSPLLFQDCSHWCLPGVPDAWNELLYAELLVKLHIRSKSP